MRNFRTLEQAKKDLEELYEYVELIEHYQPQSLAQIAVFSYTLFGNIEKAAALLNKQNYKIDGRPIEAKDISALIKTQPAKDDLLHKKVRTLYLKKTRANRRTVVTFNPYQYH